MTMSLLCDDQLNRLTNWAILLSQITKYRQYSDRGNSFPGARESSSRVEGCRDKNAPHVDYQKLSAFLKRVTPSVLDELDEIYGSTAFDGYDVATGGEPSSSIKLLTKFNTLNEADAETKISCVTWSAGGGTLALSYSAVCHDTWCNHTSSIRIFNFTKEDQFPSTPNRSLEVNSCVTALSYHPVEPSILAAGLFNGDVLVWNLRDDKSSAPLQLSAHGDSLSVVQWRPTLVNGVFPLVTAGRDGYLLVHKLTANFTNVDLYKRFKISKEHNPSEKTRPRSASGRKERAVEPGLCITALNFSTIDQTIFVLGTLCGGLYRCNIDHGTPVEGTVYSSRDTMDPVVDQFERHEGSITSIISSKTCDTFVTSGTDKEIRIYRLSQFNSLHVIGVEDTAIGLSWVVGNSNIFAAYGAGQIIMFYNLENGKNMPEMLLKTNGSETNCLQFNTKRDLVAIGVSKGNLEIWKVPQNMVY
ncbi:cytoplasmic dynein 2 intermediate chain 2-like isoform X2 [Diprion similis]|uniref:cytoplasmic dynein 2 intermediate chain 2-like isoform X2 n=1 Tax=Diprion similis TaxID=362088 RepID=UPI001EF7E548|nr:cytoplasmic dynein 2 intermediate chain 2-like isoform X2 [Diprion similis]